MNELTLPGITFTGDIHIQGDMFNIHDNQQVTIVHSGELKREPTGGSELARRLVPLFNKEEEAMKFPERIRGMKNQEITKLVNVLWEKGVISSDTKPTDFWRVLHELGFYTASDRNWNDQVFFVKRR